MHAPSRAVTINSSSGFFFFSSSGLTVNSMDASTVTGVIVVFVLSLTPQQLGSEAAASRSLTDEWRLQQLVVKRGSAVDESDAASALPRLPTAVLRGGGTRQQVTDGQDLNTVTNLSSAPAPSSKNRTAGAKLKLRDHLLSADTGQRVSIAAQSVLTFVTVFVFACAIVLTIFAWKRFSDSSLR